MSDREPVPFDKLTLTAKRGLILEYHEIVTGLHNRMADILAYRNHYDRDTGEDISGKDQSEKLAIMDDDTQTLMRVKNDAGNCLDALAETIEEGGEDVWGLYEASLGRWLEELVHFKFACEAELFDLDEEAEFAAYRKGAEA